MTTRSARLLLGAIGTTVAFASACARTGDKSAAESATVATTAAADTDDFGAPFPTDTGVSARVVSLVPAATEIIFAIGRGNRLIGRTTWDLFPDSARLIANMGDGIRPNVEVVLAAKPTLVVLYASTDNRAAADAFKRAGIPVVAIKVDRISDFERLTRQLGTTLGVSERATTVVDSVRATLEKVRAAVQGAERPSVVWPLYDAPVYVVGKGSFLSELLDIAGGSNVVTDMATPTPEVPIEEIAHRNPQLVMTTPSGSMRMLSAPTWQSVRAVREKKLVLVDTILVTRPTVTLGMAAVSLARLLHPDRAAQLP